MRPTDYAPGTRLASQSTGAIAQFPTQNCGHEHYKRLNCEKASRHTYIKILKKLLGITKSAITGQQGDRYTG